LSIVKLAIVGKRACNRELFFVQYTGKEVIMKKRDFVTLSDHEALMVLGGKDVDAHPWDEEVSTTPLESSTAHPWDETDEHPWDAD
jgi:hypothetical protein